MPKPNCFAPYPEDEIFIIPVRIDECESSFNMMREFQRADFFPSYEKGFESLLRTINYVTVEKQVLLQTELSRRWGHITTLGDFGFGFIRSPPIIKEIFFHHKELRGILFEELKAGDGISFLIALPQKGLIALEIERM